MDVSEFEKMYESFYRDVRFLRKSMATDLALDSANDLCRDAKREIEFGRDNAPKSVVDRVLEGLDQYERFPRAVRPLVARVLPAIGLARSERDGRTADLELYAEIDRRAQAADALGEAATAYLSGNTSREVESLMRPFIQTDADVERKHPQKFERIREARASLVSELGSSVAHPLIADRVAALAELKVSSRVNYPNDRLDEVEMATETFEGKYLSESMSVGGENFSKIRSSDGRTLLVPEHVEMAIHLDRDTTYRFEPWHEGDFLVSEVHEPMRGAEREPREDDVIDVCLAGAPARNSCCGDPLCVCGNEPIVSEAITVPSEARHLESMARVTTASKSFEEDFQRNFRGDSDRFR